MGTISIASIFWIKRIYLELKKRLLGQRRKSMTERLVAIVK